ncbi:MAG TPA: phosphopantothenoylcysteine decarboxylase [Tepidisphaeraceae bacterium]|nr:phosphopantothenoylcysteine decarboxylase [Tepidisphaeraceae bacterium]
MPQTRRFLVTAGNTREMIDRVRDWGNIFTGRTGLAIARELSKFGTVDLVTSTRAHLDEPASTPNLETHPFKTHLELDALLEQMVTSTKYDAIFMTAAVSDYRPAGVFAVSQREKLEDGSERWIVRNVDAPKVSSSHQHITILGEPTSKIVDRFRRDWKFAGLLVKFKLEVGIAPRMLQEIAERSRVASGADFLVANTLEMISGVEPGAYLIGDGMVEWMQRDELASRLARLVNDRLGSK